MSMCDVPAEDLWTQPYEDLLRHWHHRHYPHLRDPCFESGTARADRYQQAIAEAHKSYALYAPCCAGSCWCESGWDALAGARTNVASERT